MKTRSRLSEPQEQSLEQAKLELEILKITNRRSARELAEIHISRFGPAYVFLLVSILVWAATTLEDNKISTLIGVISPIIVGFLALFKGILGLEGDDKIRIPHSDKSSKEEDCKED
jgi:hypothetical protein